jgi:hypothetical protein
MAIWKGLEPSTSSVTGLHSNQLNYQTICGEGGIRTPGTLQYAGFPYYLQFSLPPKCL